LDRERRERSERRCCAFPLSRLSRFFAVLAVQRFAVPYTSLLTGPTRKARVFGQEPRYAPGLFLWAGQSGPAIDLMVCPRCGEIAAVGPIHELALPGIPETRPPKPGDKWRGA
jgi:hypothetical protein